MGIAKLALNFMVKNGKGELVRSVLCHTKPPKTPINFNSKFFGYVQPNGEISFESVNKAIQYAQNRCMQALDKPSPFERGIFIKDNRILKEVDGDASHIDIPFSTDFTKDTIFIHGHPENAWWLSYQDILTCLESKMKMIMAITEKGKYSSIKTNPDKIINFNNGNHFGCAKISNLNKLHIDAIGSDIISIEAKCYAAKIPEYDRENVENMFHSIYKDSGYADSSRIELAEQFIQEVVKNKKLEKRINKISEILTKKKMIIREEILQNIADKYGFVYSKSIN